MILQFEICTSVVQPFHAWLHCLNYRCTYSHPFSLLLLFNNQNKNRTGDKKTVSSSNADRSSSQVYIATTVA